MSELDIYQDLFSKIQENRDKIKVDGLDLFEVTLYDDDTILETWVRNWQNFALQNYE